MAVMTRSSSAFLPIAPRSSKALAAMTASMCLRRGSRSSARIGNLHGHAIGKLALTDVPAVCRGTHRHCAWAKWAVHPRPPSQAVAATGHPSRPISRAPTPIDTQTSLHGGRDHAAHAHQLHERAHLVDIRTRQTLKRARRIAIADGTDKVRFDLATGEEFPINSLIIAAIKIVWKDGEQGAEKQLKHGSAPR